MKSSKPRAAPNACSPRAATFVSRSRNAGRSSDSASAAAIGMSRKSGPRFGGSTTTPAKGSTGPGDEIPIPARASRTEAGTSSRARLATSRQASTMAAGPACVGVSRSVRPSREPSGRTIAARIRVPPRSTAMTGREDRAKPLVSIGEIHRSFYQSGSAIPTRPELGARHSHAKSRTPAGYPAGVEGSKVRRTDEDWLAADLEHLGPALGTGALERLLAVLHRDRLRVLDL